MLSKNLQITTIEKGEDSVRFIASTGNSDRYGDIIDQRGWELSAYRRNPVVLLNHQTNQLPIGKGLVDIVDGNLMIDVVFDQEDELAQKVERKARNGFMSSVSVGFNPVQSISRSELPEEHKAYSPNGGSYFPKAELLEVSIVTIPANSEAVSMGQKQLGLRAMIRDVIAEELRHILSVEELESSYVVEYSKAPEAPEDELEEAKYEDEDEESKKLDGDEPEKQEDEDDNDTETKAFEALIALLS